MRKLLPFLLALFAVMQAQAYDVEIDGIYYNLNNTTMEAEVTYSGYTYSGSISIPSSITYSDNTYIITRIGDYAFNYCTGLTSTTIPNTVKSIGTDAFSGCSGLTSISVALDNGVYDSRNDCNAIIETSTNSLIIGCQSTIIPDNVISIGDNAFSGYTTLTSIDIPEGVTRIGSRAFMGCTNLSTIYIPNSISGIGEYAFYNTAWYNNKSDGLIYIELIAYDYKGTMPESTSIEINDGTTCIADNCFDSCSGLSSISIPNSVTSIGKKAFSGCTGLTSISIPNGITTIDEEAFSFSGLTSITIPSNITYIGYGAFSGCTDLTSATIYGNVPSLVWTFVGCSNLKSISLPEGVTMLDGTFGDCGRLSSIIIPESVTTLGEQTFGWCTNLSSVVSKIKSPFTFGEDCFIDISSSCVLTVPYGTTAAYEAAGWTTDVFGGGIVEAPQEDVTIAIGSAGIATYCYNHDLDFSNVEGLKAYIVSGFSPSTGKLVLTPITKVKAGEGLLLQGAEGTYEVPFTTTDMYYTNLLKGVTTATEISPTSGNETNFILANGKHGIGFYTLSETGELAAGKAYLHIPTSEVESMEARCFILNFENDEATGIIEHKSMTETNDCYYDMQGRRVLHPSRGIYIVNGKKVFIK